MSRREAQLGFELWLKYYVWTEEHDRSVCREVHPRTGNAHPRTDKERSLCSQFAREMMNALGLDNGKYREEKDAVRQLTYRKQKECLKRLERQNWPDQKLDHGFKLNDFVVAWPWESVTRHGGTSIWSPNDAMRKHFHGGARIVAFDGDEAVLLKFEDGYVSHWPHEYISPLTRTFKRHDEIPIGEAVPCNLFKAAESWENQTSDPMQDIIDFTEMMKEHARQPATPSCRRLVGRDAKVIVEGVGTFEVGKIWLTEKGFDCKGLKEVPSNGVTIPKEQQRIVSGTFEPRYDYEQERCDSIKLDPETPVDETKCCGMLYPEAIAHAINRGEMPCPESACKPQKSPHRCRWKNCNGLVYMRYPGIPTCQDCNNSQLDEKPKRKMNSDFHGPDSR